MKNSFQSYITRRHHYETNQERQEVIHSIPQPPYGLLLPSSQRKGQRCETINNQEIATGKYSEKLQMGHCKPG